MPARALNKFRLNNLADEEKAGFWSFFFVCGVGLPVLVAIWPSADGQGNGVLRDFASAIGYSGAGLIVMLFALSARLTRATWQFGIDVAFHFHRYIAVAAIAAIFIHVIIVVGGGELTRDSLARLSLVAGVAALLIFCTMAWWSFARKSVKEERTPKPWWWGYHRWRLAHAVMGILAYGLLVWHVLNRAPSLDTEWKRRLLVGYLAIGAILILWARLLRPMCRVARSWSVKSLHEEMLGTWTLTLSAKSRPLKFYAGQFVWLTASPSRYGMHEHPFSIGSSALLRDGYEITLTIRAKGDFTRSISSLPIGKEVWIHGPFGRFTMEKRRRAQGYVFIGAGVGMVPFMSMLRTVADDPQRWRNKKFVLVYVANMNKPVLFRAEVDSLGNQMAGQLQIRYIPTDGSRNMDYSSQLRERIPGTAWGYEFFLCGPPDLMEKVEVALWELNVPESRIHRELFQWV